MVAKRVIINGGLPRTLPLLTGRSTAVASSAHSGQATIAAAQCDDDGRHLSLHVVIARPSDSELEEHDQNLALASLSDALRLSKLGQLITAGHEWVVSHTGQGSTWALSLKVKLHKPLGRRNVRAPRAAPSPSPEDLVTHVEALACQSFDCLAA
jgi:hypothetical protein